MKRVVAIALFLMIESDLINVSIADDGESKSLVPLINDGTWVAHASSQEAPGTDATRAVDGNPDSRWSSEFKDQQWWMLDLGKREWVGRLKILWEKAYASEFRILVSVDGSLWDEVAYRKNSGGGESLVEFSPRDVRFIKVDCLRRSTNWGFSIIEVEVNPKVVVVGKATASTGNGDYAPHFAIDGNMSTRWSSGFNDADWWQVEFVEPTEIAGLKIWWETAFSEKFEIALSDNGEEWRTVYRVEEGDGQTDIIFFEPAVTKFLRVVCNQRGTGWGNSFYEVKFYDSSKRLQASCSTSLPNTPPELAVDGNPSTAWQSEGTGTQLLELTLPERMHIGGLDLLWGDKYALEYSIETIGSDGAWKEIYRENNGNGGHDYVFFPAIETKQLRVVCRKGQAPDGFSIAQVELKSGEEQATPLRDYQAKARNDRMGMYPMWLTRQQEFWTVIGLPDDDQESLLGETGTFEPFKGAFSVQPFVLSGGKVISWADVQLEQSLEADYLPVPTVLWKADGFELRVTALALGKPGRAFTAVRYRLTRTGTGTAPSQLALAVRPVQHNRIWQHGGMSPIHKMEWEAQQEGLGCGVLKINDRVSMAVQPEPDRIGCAALRDGDAVDFLARGNVAAAIRAEDKDGKTGAAMLFDLDIPEGESRDVIALYPLHKELPGNPRFKEDAPAFFAEQLTSQCTLWREQLDRVEIAIPERRLIDVLKSNLGYVLINRDKPWFKPGSRNYNHSWMRDGALTGVAMLRMGHPELPEQFIKDFTGFIRDNGLVPYMILENGQPIGSDPLAIGGEGQEYDSQGEYVFIVRQYVDYTGDTKLLEHIYPQVIKALRFARELRRHRMTDAYKSTPDKKNYFGILPESNSHEGYYPAKHSYWDDFWYLRGLQDGAALADRMGRKEDAAWIREEEQSARSDLYASMLSVAEKHGLKVLPGCVELGDIDPTSTSVAIMAADELSVLPQPYAINTFELYYSNVTRRLAGIADTFTPYEARNIDVFIRLGWRERALDLLRHMLEHSTRPKQWNHMAEVVHAKPRAPSYIGDMPHTWVGSDLINAMRSLFAYEHDGKLFVAAGVDPKWAGEGVVIRHLPTEYGVLSYTIQENDGAVHIHVEGTATPPAGFALPLPDAWKGMTATIAGEPATAVDGAISFTQLPCELVLSPGP